MDAASRSPFWLIGDGRRMAIKKVCFCGLGIMGEPMAANLVRAGFELSVYNRTIDKAAAFAETPGVRAGVTPADAAKDADAVITILPDAPEVEQVLFGDAGAVQALTAAGTVIDMSTISPSAARSIGERLAEGGFDFVEAPVSGSRPKAEDGTLTIMVGGEERHVERVAPLLRAMGALIVHVGPRGHGQMAKLLTNTMGAVNAAALAEAIHMAMAAGLDRHAFLEVAGASAGASAVLALKGGPMFDESFVPPLFKLEHMLKDVRHCLTEARALGIELQMGALAESLYARAAAAAHAEEDFAAVCRAVRE